MKSVCHLCGNQIGLGYVSRQLKSGKRVKLCSQRCVKLFDRSGGKKK